jgi:hypothetical protein
MTIVIFFVTELYESENINAFNVQDPKIINKKINSLNLINNLYLPVNKDIWKLFLGEGIIASIYDGIISNILPCIGKLLVFYI